MSLTPGTRLGPYEIVAALGAGGMGEVYKARDAKLDRNVALKVLPSHLARDPDALARFEREAKAVAALSHPNILAIHDFGSHEGTAYAVTELLEGETLRDRLVESGALPPKKVVQIAADIARGLAAAHDKHIVHRDLKPENVFIAADGQVKILDFGLAKTVVPPADSSATSPGMAPGEAATELRTDPGTVMGTVGYMAPEQVKGRDADARSDIFALGCVLFEMSTGARAFQRETAAETMTAILREDPPALTTEGRSVPPALEEVIRHCLEKRPDERFQSARDLAFALRALSGAQTASGGAAVSAAARSPRPRLLPVAVAAVLALAAFLVGRWSAPQAGDAPVIASFEQVTDSSGVETRPTLSPDGRSLVYAVEAGNASSLYLLRIGSRQPVPLTSGSGFDTSPAFSPDGERIAFRSERDGGGIFVMNATGESVTRISDVGFDPSWSPDGREIVVSTGMFTYPTDLSTGVVSLVAVDVATGARREVLSEEDSKLQPAWSPNGHRVAYWGLQPGTGQRDLWTVAADGSEAATAGRRVTDDEALDWNPVWSPDGRYLYFSSNRGGTMNLWRIPIDEATGEVGGEPESLTTPSLWSGGFSFNGDGTQMAFASLDWRSTLYLVAFDPVRERLAGVPEPLRRSTRPIRDHEISPDGDWVAFIETGAQEDLFVATTDGSEYRRLTDDVYRDRSPVWSPDGSRLAFYSDRRDGYQLWTIRPDGSDLTQATEWDTAINFPTWSPEGDRLAAWDPGGGGTWFIASLTGDDRTTPQVMQAPESVDRFWPISWAATSVVGITSIDAGRRRGLGVLDLATEAYVPLVEEAPRMWAMASWLDADRLIARVDGEIFVLHLDGRRTHLLDVGGYDIGRSIGLSRDGGWISFAETGTQGDIWLATIR